VTRLSRSEEGRIELYRRLLQQGFSKVEAERRVRESARWIRESRVLRAIKTLNAELSGGADRNYEVLLRFAADNRIAREVAEEALQRLGVRPIRESAESRARRLKSRKRKRRK